MVTMARLDQLEERGYLDPDDAGFEGTQYWGAAVVGSELLTEVLL
jgi:hypothetical protein